MANGNTAALHRRTDHGVAEALARDGGKPFPDYPLEGTGRE